GGHDRVFAQQVVAVGESYISLCVVRIVDDGLGEGVHSFVQAFGSSFLPVVAALEIELFGFAISGRMSDSGRRRCGRRDGARLARRRFMPWPVMSGRKEPCQRRKDKKKFPFPITSGWGGRRSSGYSHISQRGANLHLHWRLGVCGRNPTIAATPDGFDENGVLRGIAERVAQTIDRTDHAAIEIHKYTVRPQALTNLFPAKNFVGTAE